MKSIKLFLGAGFGSGYSPLAPGTAGSLAALIPVYFVVQIHAVFGPVLMAVLASVITLWVSKTCVEAWGEDPGKLVMDEFAGQAITFIAVPLSMHLTSNILLLGAGFLLFRIFDIIKPFGINRLQKLEGGIGILTDDLIAGFYAFLCLKTLTFMFPEIFYFV